METDKVATNSNEHFTEKIDVETTNSPPERHDDLAIEKKMRVEDFRVLCEKFNQNLVEEPKHLGFLNKDEFIQSFQPILDVDAFGNQIEKLFDKLNSKETGLINWNDFCTYMLQFYQEEDFANSLRSFPFNNEPKIRHVPHNKQETTSKILHLNNPLRFINVSKEGTVGLWTSNLNFEKSYSIADDTDENSHQTSNPSGQNRRRLGTWISDAIFMSDVNKLILASTGRDLRFFTVSNETFMEDFHLYGLKNVPTCLEYYPGYLSENHQSVLIFGDDSGTVHLLYFKNPTNSLFDPVRRKTEISSSERASAGPQRIFWDDLREHEKFVRHLSLGAIHRESVRKVIYVPHNNSIIASSGDNQHSIIITHINRLKKPYVFRLYKGCESFDFSKQLNLLITGTADYLARIWNPYVTKRNIAVLEGHHSAVIDVKINDRLGQCYTYAKDAIVKAWDLKEFICLQTIILRFPTTLNGKTPTFGMFPMDLYLNMNKATVGSAMPGALILGCNDYLCLMKLGQDVTENVNFPETHKAAVSCAVYNSKLRQVVTCADNSSMGAWDIETGRKAFFIIDAHDGEEITCITIDRPCRKLATGARNGIIKIWNSASGLNLLVLPRLEDAEITGSLFFDKGLITVGWSRKIVKYSDIVSDDTGETSTDGRELVMPKADLSWRGSQIHRDDILCLESLLPISNLMCTASYDGEIHVWSIDTEKIVVSLRKSSKPDSRFASSSRSRLTKRPATPVDKLLFLRARAKDNMKYGVLFSSEAGYLRCWSIYGERKEMGVFLATSKKGESILSMCTDGLNNHLITGDTAGEIRLWNIKNYCCSIVSPVLYETKPPPLLQTWQAHLSPIIYCEWIDYRGHGNYILTASTDHTARLWTTDGNQIGIFGQRQIWNIDIVPVSQNDRENQVPQIEVNFADQNDKQDGESTVSSIITNSVILPSVIMSTIDENRPSSSSSSHRSEMSYLTPGLPPIDRANLKTPKGLGLGLMVEKDLKQRQKARQERRNRYAGIDGRQLVKGGLYFTPFALLSTQDVEDVTLQHFHRPKSNLHFFDDFNQEGQTDLSLTREPSPKDRSFLPPIISRQTTSASTLSIQTTSTLTALENEISTLGLNSKATFMAPISEI